MELQVTEIAVAAENGNLKPLYQFYKNTKNGPKVAMPLFLPSGATTPQEWPVCGGVTLQRILDHSIKTVPCDNLANSLQEIRTQVQTIDTGEGTLVKPACNSMQEIRTDTREDKTQQHEAACDPVFAGGAVDELSQVAGTRRSGKAIGVDSIPPEAGRVAGKAYWCQLAEIAEQVVSCNQFPDVWKVGIMCGVPRKPGVPLTPEHTQNPCLHSNQHHDRKGPQQTCRSLY